MSPSQEDKSLR